ncbi:uncharacterized protein LOC144656044 isoform X2 [Oculina patagonica]
MASVSDEERDKKSGRKLCSKSRKCSKNDRHHGKCDSRRTVNPFWVRSPIQVGNSIKREARNVASEVEAECEIKKARIDEKEARVSVRESEVIEKERQIQEVEEKYATARVETEKLER